MTEFLTELIKELSPEFFSFLAVVIGALIAKFTGAARGWGLSRRAQETVNAAVAEVQKLRNNETISPALAGVLEAGLRGFGSNVAQIEKTVLDDFQRFGNQLRK